jgi:archaellum component FlaF (FlaF/FlaG flagellin family)
MKKLLFFCLVVFAACNSKPKTQFEILKSEKIKDGVKLDVQVKGRISKQQLIDIACFLRNDSADYKNVQVDYLLPGNSYKNKGGVTVYATAAYHDKAVVVPADTIRDKNNDLLGFEFVGFSPEEAKQMLALEHQEMKGKQILGRFLDDNTKTTTIIYEDKGNDSQLYILELDANGQVVSAIQPMEVTVKGVKKMVVSQEGDYMVLKDSLSEALSKVCNLSNN